MRSEAGVEAIVCFEARVMACSGAGSKDIKRRRHDGVLGDRRARALSGFKKMLSVARESAGPKIL
jgi:hypothetical protein